MCHESNNMCIINCLLICKIFVSMFYCVCMSMYMFYVMLFSFSKDYTWSCLSNVYWLVYHIFTCIDYFGCFIFCFFFGLIFIAFSFFELQIFLSDCFLWSKQQQCIVTVCVFVRHLFSWYPFYFDFHSARIIFDVSSGFPMTVT
jgi:hypothetical protein